MPRKASAAAGAPAVWRWGKGAVPDDVRAVLAGADLAAERTAARVRVGALIVIGLLLIGLGSLAGRYSGWIAMIFALNLGISIAALALARPVVFGAWVPWVLATLDAAALLGVMVLGDVGARLPGSYTPALVVSWAMFPMLALTAMRLKPALVLYLGGLLVAGLAAVMGFGAAAATGLSGGAFGDHVELVFDPGHNTIRLALVALTAFVLAVTVARGRSTMVDAVLAARRSANLSRYLPSGLLPLLAETDVAELKHGRRQLAAILFADIRGFTALSESLDPRAIAEFLASFRCRATRAIERHGGIVDKFVGDDVMGVFGVPTATPGDAGNALAAGRELVAEIDAWNEKRRGGRRRPVAVGIGVHYGEVFAGIVDGGERLEFTVIGDAVNIAHRIEELTKATGRPLLVSEALLAAAGGAAANPDCRPLAAQMLRGRKMPIRLFASNAESTGTASVPAVATFTGRSPPGGAMRRNPP